MLKPPLESFFCNRLTIDLRKRKKEFTLLVLIFADYAQYAPKYDIGAANGQAAGGPYNYGKLNWERNNCCRYILFVMIFIPYLKRRKNNQKKVHLTQT